MNEYLWVKFVPPFPIFPISIWDIVFWKSWRCKLNINLLGFTWPWFANIGRLFQFSATISNFHFTFIQPFFFKTFFVFFVFIQYSNSHLIHNIHQFCFFFYFLINFLCPNWKQQRHVTSSEDILFSSEKSLSQLFHIPPSLLWVGGPWRVSIVRGGSQGEIDGALRLSLPSLPLTQTGVNIEQAPIQSLVKMRKGILIFVNKKYLFFWNLMLINIKIFIQRNSWLLGLNASKSATIFVNIWETLKSIFL